MDESLKEKSREGLLDSPDSGLPPSPSPPFYSLSPGGGADPPAPGQRREAKDGRGVRAEAMVGEGGEGFKGRWNFTPGAFRVSLTYQRRLEVYCTQLIGFHAE